MYSCLWCPHLRKYIIALENEKPQIQNVLYKTYAIYSIEYSLYYYSLFIEGLIDLSYKDRLTVLNIYSLEA